MSGRVSKESWDVIFLRARKLWNQFDPIGVVALVDDEYDYYAGEAALLATKFATEDEFRVGAKNAVYQTMGLSTPITLVDDFGTLLHRELTNVAQGLADQGMLFDN